MDTGIWVWIARCRKVEQSLLWVCICLVPILLGLMVAGVGITLRDMASAWGVIVAVTLLANYIRKWLVRRARGD